MNDDSARDEDLFDRIHRLVSARISDELTTEQFAELESLLAGSEDARRLYLQYIYETLTLPALLQEGEGLQVDGDEVLSVENGDTDSLELPFPEFSPTTFSPPTADMRPLAAPVFSSTFSSFENTWRVASGFFSQEIPLGFLVATLLTGVLLLGLWLTPVSRSTTPPIADAEKTPSTDAVAPDVEPKTQSAAASKPRFVGRITGSADCRWEQTGRWGDKETRRRGDAETGSAADQASSQKHKTESPRLPVSSSPRLVCLGDKLAIASGLLEITYDSGAKVILEGPCRFNVETNGGFLAVGRLTGRLEKTRRQGEKETGSVAGQTLSQTHELESPSLPISHSPSLASSTPTPTPTLTSTLTPTPFVIATPTALVTDLGTEFGVVVNDAGETISHVFRGSVKLAGIGEQKTPEIILAANDSARVTKIKSLAGASKQAKVAVQCISGDTAAAATFIRTMPSPNSVRESEAYGRMVLSMNPAVYYRMEMPKDPKKSLILRDSAPGHHDGVIHFAEGYMDDHPYIYGRFGTALHLRGPMLKDYAIVNDYPKAKDGRLTVSAWVLSMGRGQPCIIGSNWLIGVGPNEPRLGQFVMYFSFLTNGNFAGRGREANGHEVILQEGQTWSSAFPTGVWQHVAQVFDGHTMRLYRNGVEVACCPFEGILRNPPLQWLTIGCEAVRRDDKTEWMGFWQGGIDEFALFNRALSPAEIGQLFVGKMDDKPQPQKAQ